MTSEVGHEHAPPQDEHLSESHHLTTTAQPLHAVQHHVAERPRTTGIFRYFLRLDFCWTFVFFLFLLCVGALTTSVSQKLISRSLLDSWRDLHGARVESIIKRLSVGLDRVHDIATSAASLHLQEATQFESENTVRVLCSTLDNYDKQTRFRALLVLSKNLSEACGCMHGLRNTGSMRTLTAFMSTNHIVRGSYLIDNTTYTFKRPLTMMSEWSPKSQNLSVTMPAAYDDDPLFPAAVNYYSSETNANDLSLRWAYRSAMPHLVFYSLPAGFLTRGMTTVQSLRPTDFIQVRLDGSLLLSNYDYLKAPDFSVAAFMTHSLNTSDPLVLSNNWRQPSSSNNSIYAASLDANVTYLHISNISDALMRSALKHVCLRRLQEKEYQETIVFSYHGAVALATAYAHTFSQGLTVPFVFVSAQESVTGPYRRIMYICDGMVAIAIVLLTALFWWFVHRLLSKPLEDMTEHLQSSLKPGKRAVFHHGTDACVQLSEVSELLQVYDATMKQLREIDTYIPEALRARILRGASLDDLLSNNTSLTVSQSPSGAAAQMATLMQLDMTVVYLRIRPRRTSTPHNPLIEVVDTTERAPRRGQWLVAVVESAAQASSLVNSGPFPSRAALAAFASAVHELSSAHHGTVHTLTPDSCVIHFYKAIRHYQVRHPNTAAAAASQASTATTPKQSRKRPNLDRLVAWDAHEAVAFALDLQRWVDKYDADSLPDVRVLVDTSSFACGQYRAEGSEQTLSVALGRDVMREIGHVPAAIDVRVALTEETATRVRSGRVGTRIHGVRQLPVEALRIGRERLDADVIILYEALPGKTTGNVAWHRYSGFVFDAFALMLRADYAGAHRALSQIAHIADLEPGLMPQSLRREAAPTDVVGGAVSVQAERLMRECDRRLAAHITTGFYRARRVPYGIDAVLKGVQLPVSPSLPYHFLPEVIDASHSGDSADRAGSSALASRTPHPGVRAPVMMSLSKPKERFVVTVHVKRQYVRHVIADPPRWIKDNYGMFWYLPVAPGQLTYLDYYSLTMTGLGSAGLLSTVTVYLLNDVPPVVAKLIATAPEGIMSDALRSAVPVCEPSAHVRAQLLKLFYGHRHLRHPNLLIPEGYSCTFEGGIAMIGEYCPGGTLRDFVQRYDHVKPLTVIRFGLCVLSGLSYLHRKSLVHGALSMDTVLVGADGVCRLNGYFFDYTIACTLLALRRTYFLSPAMAAGAAPTPACDMFCYGLVALEVLAKQPPWMWAAVTEEEEEADWQLQGSEEELAALLKRGGHAFSDAVVEGRVVVRTSLLDDAVVSDHYSALARDAIRSCLSYNPAERPTAEAVWEVNRTLLEQAGLKVADDDSH